MDNAIPPMLLARDPGAPRVRVHPRKPWLSRIPGQKRFGYHPDYWCGEEGGYLNAQSSPFVLWWLRRLGAL